MEISFKNNTALVTGAASGLGLAAAAAFAEAGASVALIDLNEDLVNRASNDLQARGFDIIGLQCDVADDAQVEMAIKKVVDKFGRLDAAYNNAGIMTDPTNAADQSREDYDKTMGINLRGVWACMKYEIQAMSKTGGGAIVNCSSIGGIRGGTKRGIYHAAKHGVLGLTTSAAIEYASKGIRINAVCPGTFYTPLVEKLEKIDPDGSKKSVENVPIKRMGKPEEVADAVLWLCSDKSSYVIGHGLVIDGGLTI